MDFFTKDNFIAVVGVSPEEQKYGTRVYRTLKKLGYKVVAINPKYQELFGDKVYPSISQLKKVPDLVITVVPPVVTTNIAKEAIKLKVNGFWMQPGSESAEAKELLRNADIETVEACFVVDGLHEEFID